MGGSQPWAMGRGSQLRALLWTMGRGSQLWAMGVGESQLWEGAEQPNNVMPQQLMPSAAGSIRRKTINKVTLSN